jgi:hypothetical protein
MRTVADIAADLKKGLSAAVADTVVIQLADLLAVNGIAAPGTAGAPAPTDAQKAAVRSVCADEYKDAVLFNSPVDVHQKRFHSIAHVEVYREKLLAQLNATPAPLARS